MHNYSTRFYDFTNPSRLPQSLKLGNSCHPHECPLVAISRHPEGHTRAPALPPKADIGELSHISPLSMSALPPIADINGYGTGGLLLTHSGHCLTGRELFANPPHLWPHVRCCSTANDTRDAYHEQKISGVTDCYIPGFEPGHCVVSGPGKRGRSSSNLTHGRHVVV